MALKYLPAYLTARNRGEIPRIKWWSGVPHIVAVLRKRREQEEAQKKQQEQAQKERQLCIC